MTFLELTAAIVAGNLISMAIVEAYRNYIKEREFKAYFRASRKAKDEWKAKKAAEAEKQTAEPKAE